jgi:hypothetical protein
MTKQKLTPFHIEETIPHFKNYTIVGVPHEKSQGTHLLQDVLLPLHVRDKFLDHVHEHVELLALGLAAENERRWSCRRNETENGLLLASARPESGATLHLGAYACILFQFVDDIVHDRLGKEAADLGDREMDAEEHVVAYNLDRPRQQAVALFPASVCGS